MMRKIKNIPFITYGLVSIMVLYFVVMTCAGGTENSAILLHFGAEYNPLIKAGEWWRLITPIFIHIGYQHLILNLIVLYYFGRIIELYFGHLKFLIIFIGSGIMGNLMSFAFENGISAGSSTSIFGLFGAFAVLYLKLKNDPFIQNYGKTCLLFIVLNFVMDIFMPNVSLIGHIGGLLGGYLISMIIGIKGFKTLNKKSIIIYANALILGIIIMYYIGLNR
ncbi:rhomboid family intramembrane serine protease [Fructilactobacillus sp. Tb1]|uniref:rhomboid family intramembrane serine protease n=1 Tax=Fructilactobacillus sp. Tb1 TaxID=3422304 RepID=UPI003D27629B